MTTRLFVCALVAFAVTALFALAPAHAAQKTDYTKMPGYVDFGAMEVFGDEEATVEVFLKGSLLAMAREAVGDEDPELKHMLANIEYIHVQVFDLDDVDSKRVMEKTSAVAKELEKKGWEIAVRVREDDEQVHVYLMPGKDNRLAGLVVMAVEEGDEAAFVNIVGDIDPENIGKLGRSFHMDSIDIDWDDVHVNQDDTGDEKSEKRKSRTNRR